MKWLHLLQACIFVSVICTFNLNTDENRWRTAILTLLMEHVRINYENHCITGRCRTNKRPGLAALIQQVVAWVSLHVTAYASHQQEEDFPKTVTGGTRRLTPCSYSINALGP